MATDVGGGEIGTDLLPSQGIDTMAILYREIKESEVDADNLKVYFDLRQAADIAAPATSEGGNQPQVSVNGGAWTNTGIGTLTHVGNGLYYASLSAASVLQNSNIGDIIHTRYKSVNTIEARGTSIKVVENMDGYTVEKILKTLLSFAAGVTAGGGSNSITFKSPDGDFDRISMSTDNNGNRTSVTLSHAEA